MSEQKPMLHINCQCGNCKSAYQRGFDQAKEMAANAGEAEVRRMVYKGRVRPSYVAAAIRALESKP